MLDKIDHFVVLMMENRSFDQMLGHLYDPANPPPFQVPPRGQSFEGVSGRGLTNPIPSFADPEKRFVIPVGRTSDMTNPNPDPGEEFPHVTTQLYGESPTGGERAATLDWWPFGRSAALPATPPMSGFVADYANVLKAATGRVPTYDEMAVIMQGFTPRDVPVISQLAYHYAVLDHWHASVPSQTFGNRSFVHAATSHGFVDNMPIHKWLFHFSETIFNRLGASSELDFRIYWDPLDIVSWTFLLNPAIWPHARSKGRSMEEFFDDAARGRLPAYSFIEPRLLVDHNDQHPPAGLPPFYVPIVRSSVLAGEELIASVYRAVRESPAWERTMLILIYDEHGGCFDHVPPPAAVPPDPKAGPGELGFAFDRLGVRIPAIVVSPFTEAGTIDHGVYDHTSIIKTICNRFRLEGLTARDRSARDLSALLSLSRPRQDLPVITPRPYEPTPEADRLGQPLSGFQKGLLALAAGRQGLDRLDGAASVVENIMRLGHLVETEWEILKMRTVGDAIALLKELDASGRAAIRPPA